MDDLRPAADTRVVRRACVVTGLALASRLRGALAAVRGTSVQESAGWIALVGKADAMGKKAGPQLARVAVAAPTASTRDAP